MITGRNLSTVVSVCGAKRYKFDSSIDPNDTPAIHNTPPPAKHVSFTNPLENPCCFRYAGAVLTIFDKPSS
jgi:hypothetical protein